MNNELRLIETMLWQNGRIFLERLHMERLAASARSLSFRFDPSAVKLAVDRSADGIPPGEDRRVRLLLSPGGQTDITVSPLSPIPAEPVKIRLSARCTDSRDPFLAHKTTRRELYDEELEKGRAEGFFETVFLNEKGRVTEGTISNILIEKNGKLLTPPLSCGVLPGVYREYLFNSDNTRISERILIKEDLTNAAGIFICNSVMKMVRAELAR